MNYISLLLLSLVGALTFIPRVAVTYLPVHLMQIGLNSYLLGLTMLLFGCGYFFGSILFKQNFFRNYRTMLIFFILIIFVFMCYLFYKPSITLLTLFIGMALGYLSSAVNLFLVLDHDKQSSVSIYRIFLNISAAMASVGFSLLAINHYSTIAWIVILTMGICIYLSLSLKKNYQKISESHRSKERLINSSFDLRIFCIFNIIINIIYSQFYLLGPIYFVHVYHVALVNFAILGAINTGCILLFEYSISKWLEKFNIKLSLLVGAFLITLSEGLLPFGHGCLYLYLAFTPFILGEILFFPASTLMPRRLAPNEKSVSQFVATSSAWRSVAIVLSPLLFSVTHQLWNGNLYLYFCFIFSLLLMLLSMLQLLKVKGKQHENRYYSR